MQNKAETKQRMRIIDYAPYILGKEFLPGTTPITYVPVPESVYTDFADRLAHSATYETNLNLTENHKDFFRAEPDIAHYTPSQYQAELYYTAKLGYYVQGVPAICLYMVSKALEQHNLPNLVVKQLPESFLKTVFTEGFFGNGYCLRDVICTLSGTVFTPVSSLHLKDVHDKYSEVYVAETDMIAAIPNDIASVITNESAKDLRVTQDGLWLRDILVRTMGSYAGVINSIYDLRELL